MIGIVGYGAVGKAIEKLFPGHQVYDKLQETDIGLQKLMRRGLQSCVTKEEMNKRCDLVFICVPTPTVKGVQDLSAIHDVMSWLRVPNVVIKSTILPGTTENLRREYRWFDALCFSPEFIGESDYYIPDEYLSPTDPSKHPFLILGGTPEHRAKILPLLQRRLGPTKTYFQCSSLEAECIKYLTNTYFAMKLSFFHEWASICKKYGADFSTVREGALLDPRIGPMHTLPFNWSGRCLPKDLEAFLSIIKSPLLEAIKK